MDWKMVSQEDKRGTVQYDEAQGLLFKQAIISSTVNLLTEPNPSPVPALPYHPVSSFDIVDIFSN